MKTGLQLIAEERQRQVEVEGWTPEHDDEHSDGELSDAAACYACTGKLNPYRNNVISMIWPWKFAWWKPTPDDRIRELVKAGALIVAEIERLQRKANVNQ